MAKAKLYHSKLLNIKKDMAAMHEKATRLKVRTNKTAFKEKFFIVIILKKGYMNIMNVNYMSCCWLLSITS